MAQIILLNGPAGVGKTTIGKLLAKHLDESVCISGDVLKEVIINRTENVHRRMGYKNGATLVNNFINAGYKNIIFEYVFPSNEQIEYFIQELETGLNPVIFTLWASLETLQQRDSKKNWMHSVGTTNFKMP